MLLSPHSPTASGSYRTKIAYLHKLLLLIIINSRYIKYILQQGGLRKYFFNILLFSLDIFNLYFESDSFTEATV